MVRGKVRANNDQNVVQVDDFGPQKDTVNEIPGGIYAPTAVTKASAKAIGRRLLAMTKKAEGNEKLMGTLMSSRVQPGDVISYETITDSERKIVLSTRHYLTQRKSDIDINSVDGSIEDILQRFQEVDISSSTRDNEERNRQFSQEEFATAFDYKFKITWRVETREVKRSNWWNRHRNSKQEYSKRAYAFAVYRDSHQQFRRSCSWHYYPHNRWH